MTKFLYDKLLFSIIWGIRGPMTVAPMQVNERKAIKRFDVRSNWADSVADKTNGNKSGKPWVRTYPAAHETFALETLWDIACL